MHTIKRLIIHCAATPNGKHLGTVTKNAAQIIDEWHRARGFKRRYPYTEQFNPHLKAIGYHYVIDTDGRLMTGRAPAEVGAHVAGQNTGSLGIYMVGTDKFTHQQWKTLHELIEDLKFAYQGVDIKGHNDFTNKKICPGFKVAEYIANGFEPKQEWIYETK